MIKLSDYVFKLIAEQNVEHVFMLPGGGCMHLVDSLGNNKDLQYVGFLHEQGATIAAEAYGQYTNNLGVALVTTGPGGTNAITGAAGAWIDSTPLLVISGQVKRSDMIGDSGLRQRGIQEVDIVPIVAPITKYAVTIEDPSSIRYHLEKAIYSAKSGRPGPVWIDIPLDVQGVSIDETELRGFMPDKIIPDGAGGSSDSSGLEGQVDKVVSLINGSERPVILAGNGIRLAGASESFLSLIDELGIPVLTTWRMIDLLPEDHGIYFGRPGSIAQRGANFIQQNCDLLITIGARLDLAQIGYNYENVARAARKVVVDIDESEIDKLRMQIDVRVCEDAGAFIKGLRAKADRVQAKDRSDWLNRCRSWKETYPVVLPEYLHNDGLVNTYALVAELSEQLSGADVLVPGSSGSCSEITLQSFKASKGQRILNTPGLGSMGFGLPAAIGACIASGFKRTTTIIGDGGLQHNIQELETAARLNLPLKIFVINNNGYASIRNTQDRHFCGRLVGCDPSCGLTLPDTCRIAGAYGLTTELIENQKDLSDKVRAVLDVDGPVVCEVMVDPFLQTAPRISTVVKEDGSIVSKPLEDLWPFLETDEFKANMIIEPLEE